MPSCHSRPMQSRHHEVDLGPVEGGLARLGGVGQAQLVADGFQRVASARCQFSCAADVLVAGRVAEAEPDAVVVQAQAS